MRNPGSLLSLFLPVPSEGDARVTQIEGEVPSFVRGTWVMNGPSRFERAGLKYRHWLDGDGMLRAVRFTDREVSFSSRWIRSEKWKSEEGAGRALYRTFGTSFDGDRLNSHGVGIESPVNVSVFPFGEHLLAFGEQGLPYAVDPETLDTIGPFTFGGALNGVSPFSAHPTIDEVFGELYNFGISFSKARPCLNYYRFGRSGRLLSRRRTAIPRPSSVHDFALGPRHAVFYLSPDVLDMEVLLSGGSVIDALSWNPHEPSVLLVLDRFSGERVSQIPVEGRYCLHLVNCFEDGENLVVDLLELHRPIYPEYQVVPDLFAGVGAANPVRYRLHLATGTVTEKRVVASDCLYDFPVVDSRTARRPTKHSWMVGISETDRPGVKFLDRLVRVDWDTDSMEDCYQVPAGWRIASEPMVVPDNAGAGPSAILCRAIDLAGKVDHVLVFDGLDLSSGPSVVLELPMMTPPSFHGCWLPRRFDGAVGR